MDIVPKIIAYIFVSVGIAAILFLIGCIFYKLYENAIQLLYSVKNKFSYRQWQKNDEYERKWKLVKDRLLSNCSLDFAGINLDSVKVKPQYYEMIDSIDKITMKWPYGFYRHN